MFTIHFGYAMILLTGIMMETTQNTKKGLVMEGGAMRGMFTCGVFDVFMENEAIKKLHQVRAFLGN